jgi:quercetin dioxygenase-like cupin family protein
VALIVTPEDRELHPYPGAKQGLKLSHLRPDDPYVHMTEVPPGYHIDLHSHSEAEVTVILGGSARVGDRVCGAGSVLVIEANEEYALVAGDDEPLTFIVVRPRKATYQLSE